MKIIKRNGAEEVFDIKKIVIAVTKADSSSEGRSLTDSQIEDIAEFVEFKCNKLNRAVSVEEIQDLVEDQIMATGAFELAKRYVRYRYKRSLVRKANTTDNRILSLIECNNEDVKQENSNKNPAVPACIPVLPWQSITGIWATMWLLWLTPPPDGQRPSGSCQAAWRKCPPKRDSRLTWHPAFPRSTRGRA